jgi:hypothetical protein
MTGDFPTERTPRVVRLLFAILPLLCLFARPASVLADASAQSSAEGADALYESESGNEALTTPLYVPGTCTGEGGAIGQASISGGITAVTTHASGNPPGSPGCGASSVNSIATAQVSDVYRLVSDTVPVGTLTTVTVCYRLLSTPDFSGDTGGSFSNNISCHQSVSLCASGGSTGQLCVSGDYTENQTYQSPPSLQETGPYLPGSEYGTLTFENVAVGGLLNFSVNVYAQSILTIIAPGSGSIRGQEVIGFGLTCADPDIHIVSTATLEEAPGEGDCDSTYLETRLLPDPAAQQSGVGDGRALGDHSGLALRASPNPTRAATDIGFDLPGATTTELDVFDAGGRHVRTLLSGEQSKGAHTLVWDGTDDGGMRVSPGIYFLRLVAGQDRDARRLILLE